MCWRINSILTISCSVIFFKIHTSCKFNMRCFKPFSQLYHENNALEEVIKLLQAAFSKYPSDVNNQGELHFVPVVLASSRLSFVVCRSKYRNLGKKVEEDANTSLMAAKYLRLKVAEKKSRNKSVLWRQNFDALRL